MALADTFGALRERRFRLLWIGQTTSTLGDGFVPVALAFAVIGTLDRSATALGVVLASHMLPLVGFVLVGGVWADRLPRQFVMLASDVVRAVVQATLAVLLLTGSAELWHLVVLIAIYGTAEAFFQPAATGLVPATVSPPRSESRRRCGCRPPSPCCRRGWYCSYPACASSVGSRSPSPRRF